MVEITIRNMVLPKSCAACRFGHRTYMDDRRCEISQSIYGLKCTEDEVPPDCPLKEKEDSSVVIHARWVKEKTRFGWDGRSYQCSACGRSVHLDPSLEDIILEYPFCHCGAKMTQIAEA